MNDTTEAFGIGDNRPPQEPVTDADMLADRLQRDYDAQLKRRDELLEALDRLPEVIEDETWKDHATNFMKFCQSLIGTCEDLHKAEKKPFLEAGRSVDTFFNRDIIARIKDAKDTADKRIAAYNKRVWEAEQERIREEEKKAAEAEEEARRKAEEAAASAQNNEELQAAIEAEEAAAKAAEERSLLAESANDAKVTDATRTRTEAGVTSSTRIEWTGKISSLNDLDVEALKHDIKYQELEAAVKRFAKRTKGLAELKGAVIEKQYKTSIR